MSLYCIKCDLLLDYIDSLRYMSNIFLIYKCPRCKMRVGFESKGDLLNEAHL